MPADPAPLVDVTPGNHEHVFPWRLQQPVTDVKGGGGDGAGKNPSTQKPLASVCPGSILGQPEQPLGPQQLAFGAQASMPAWLPADMPALLRQQRAMVGFREACHPTPVDAPAQQVVNLP